MRGTDATALTRKGIRLSNSIRRHRARCHTTMVVQPTGQGYTTFHRFMPSHGDALKFRERTA